MSKQIVRKMILQQASVTNTAETKRHADKIRIIHRAAALSCPDGNREKLPLKVFEKINKPTRYWVKAVETWTPQGAVSKWQGPCWLFNRRKHFQQDLCYISNVKKKEIIFLRIYSYFFSEKHSTSKVPENYFKILKAWDPGVNNTSLPKPYFNVLIFSSLFDYCSHQLIAFKSELKQLQNLLIMRKVNKLKGWSKDKWRRQNFNWVWEATKVLPTWKGVSDELASSNRRINHKKIFEISCF